MSPSIVIASPSLNPCCCASLRPMTQALRSFLNTASCSGGTWNSGYRSKNVSGSTASRRCRNRFLRTILSSFTPAPSLQLALVEVAHGMRPLDGVRIVRHHHDGLLEFLVHPLEQRQHLFGGLAIQIAGRLVRHEDRGVGGDGARDSHAF